MTYPPLNLEKALAGEPVVYLSATGEKKAYIHQMIAANQLFIEYMRGSEIDVTGPYESRNIGSVVLGMWQETPKFKFNYWDFIDKNIVLIEKESDPDEFSIWRAKDGNGFEFDLPLASWMLPGCPVGTIIKRPD